MPASISSLQNNASPVDTLNSLSNDEQSASQPRNETDQTSTSASGDPNDSTTGAEGEVSDDSGSESDTNVGPITSEERASALGGDQALKRGQTTVRKEKVTR